MTLLHTLGVFLAAFFGCAYLWELQLADSQRDGVVSAILFSLFLTLALTF